MAEDPRRACHVRQPLSTRRWWRAYDLSAVVEEAGLRDPALKEAAATPGPRALAAVLDHVLVGDTVRFALTAEATALRKRLGSIWTR